MLNIIGLCSCPRLGYMDCMGQGLTAFAQLGVSYKNLYGVYWEQAMSNGISDALKEGYDYIVTTDYDSIYTADDIAHLIYLMEQNPQADAVCGMQVGRFSGLLVSRESGEISRAELTGCDMVPITTGHFGLTVLRASSLKTLWKPWFWCKPDSDKEWKGGSDKTDSDIYFWKNFKASGKHLYLAPKVVVGHLELTVKWPDLNIQPVYQTVSDYHKNGPPADTWK